MKRLALLLCVLFLLMPVDARPEGIGSLGDNGCVCHGGIDENVIIEITGFPEIYVPSQVYNISISADGSSKDSVGNTSGGFRALMDGGNLEIEGSQEIEGGLTHTLESNKQRMWNGTWVAPSNDDEGINLILHINLVNGDNTTSDDDWNTKTIFVSGPEYVGDTDAIEVGGEIVPIKLTVALMILATIGILAWVAIKD
jgi:hypothetical protein|tara:strand:- start:1816 stop:2409 length:594 start_codon:yes stop_codon:yes gene_type:complete